MAQLLSNIEPWIATSLSDALLSFRRHKIRRKNHCNTTSNLMTAGGRSTNALYRGHGGHDRWVQVIKGGGSRCSRANNEVVNNGNSDGQQSTKFIRVSDRETWIDLEIPSATMSLQTGSLILLKSVEFGIREDRKKHWSNGGLLVSLMSSEVKFMGAAGMGVVGNPRRMLQHIDVRCVMESPDSYLMVGIDGSRNESTDEARSIDMAADESELVIGKNDHGMSGGAKGNEPTVGDCPFASMNAYCDLAEEDHERLCNLRRDQEKRCSQTREELKQRKQRQNRHNPNDGKTRHTVNHKYSTSLPFSNLMISMGERERLERLAVSVHGIIDDDDGEDIPGQIVVQKPSTQPPLPAGESPEEQLTQPTDNCRQNHPPLQVDGDTSIVAAVGTEEAPSLAEKNDTADGSIESNEEEEKSEDFSTVDFNNASQGSSLKQSTETPARENPVVIGERSRATQVGDITSALETNKDGNKSTNETSRKKPSLGGLVVAVRERNTSFESPLTPTCEAMLDASKEKKPPHYVKSTKNAASETSLKSPDPSQLETPVGISDVLMCIQNDEEDEEYDQNSRTQAEKTREESTSTLLFSADTTKQSDGTKAPAVANRVSMSELDFAMNAFSTERDNEDTINAPDVQPAEAKDDLNRKAVLPNQGEQKLMEAGVEPKPNTKKDARASVNLQDQNKDMFERVENQALVEVNEDKSNSKRDEGDSIGPTKGTESRADQRSDVFSEKSTFEVDDHKPSSKMEKADSINQTKDKQNAVDDKSNDGRVLHTTASLSPRSGENDFSTNQIPPRPQRRKRTIGCLLDELTFGRINNDGDDDRKPTTKRIRLKGSASAKTSGIASFLDALLGRHMKW